MANVIRLIAVDEHTASTNPGLFESHRVIWSTNDEVTPIRDPAHSNGKSYRIFYRLSDFTGTVNITDLIGSVDALFHSKFPGEKFSFICTPLVCDNAIHLSLTRSFKQAMTSYGGTLACIEKPSPMMSQTVAHGRHPAELQDDSTGDRFFDRYIREIRTASEYDDEMDDDDDDDDDDDRKSSHRDEKCASRSLSSAKHPKRDIKRHNIIVASKKDVRRDEKIIRAFLKEFIPGKSEWIKKYREDVSKRWIRTFVVKEKEAERRQKEFRAAQKKAKISKYRRTIIGSGKVADNRGHSAFYDPNK